MLRCQVKWVTGTLGVKPAKNTASACRPIAGEEARRSMSEVAELRNRRATATWATDTARAWRSGVVVCSSEVGLLRCSGTVWLSECPRGSPLKRRRDCDRGWLSRYISSMSSIFNYKDR